MITQAETVAASRREREARPVHLLVALSEGFGPIAAALNRNGPLHAPMAVATMNYCAGS